MFAEDTSVFVSDFGTACVINGVAARGVFDSEYGEAFGGLISGNAPQLRIRSSVSAALGQTVTVGADSYLITSVEPDGTGMTLLKLEKQ